MSAQEHTVSVLIRQPTQALAQSTDHIFLDRLPFLGEWEVAHYLQMLFYHTKP